MNNSFNRTVILEYPNSYLGTLPQNTVEKGEREKEGKREEESRKSFANIHILTKFATYLPCLGYLASILSSIQSLSRVQLFATPRTAACQASLSITNSQSLLKLTSIESVMPSNHLILCRPLLLLPTIPPSIRVFSNESTLHMR